MAIFGHNLDDDDHVDVYENRQMGGVYTPPVDCIAISITVKVTCTTAAKNMKCAIYGPTDLDVSSPYAWPLIAETQEVSVPANGVFWQKFPFPVGSRPNLTGGKEYWLCACCEAGDGVMYEHSRLVANGTGTGRGQTTAYADFPPENSLCSVQSLPVTGDNDHLVCIYCTYQLASDPTSPTETASGLWPREYFISGYLPRYQKRQVVGYYSESGDLRPIEVNASGHLFTDIEVEVSSGQHVVISGQPVTISGDHVFIESGAYVVADIAESGIGVQVQSGLHVMISGQHVHLESGDTIDTYLYGQHVLSGDWRPISVCSSGEVTVCSGLYVVADIAESGMGVQVQSGLHVVVSGQPVTISGDHVFVESGIARLHGYHPASGIWVPIAVTLSGCIAMTYCSSGGIFG